MKFLCDVHISYKLVNYIDSIGFEAIHVNTILNKWNTKDKDICIYADSQAFVVITKDVDFRDSFFITGTPKKLIKINLGNISNADLIEIFRLNIQAIARLNIYESFLVEIDKDQLTYVLK